ncbi:MAG TPA: tripartite tricarboxylate transporter substrate binding protein [Kiloniellaceae bacterium]|nr:tripartite tricarboxylate transporter substrate binding protein [Kiloniellaceae bacterium]HIP77886.1 tripartite tricarboxylate transporter substrate binding protein [Kiloniellaceae bacterium]
MNSLVRHKKVFWTVLAALFSAVLSASPSWADFPEKEITLIVNYGAGGGTDLSSRVLAKAAEKTLGVPIRVVNKTGGGGTVGPANLANAKPDGYTIGITSFSPMAVSPHLRAVPYSIDSFDFILGHARYRSGLSVSNDSPYQTLDDLVAAARDGKELSYAATDSLTRVLVARLMEMLDVKFKAVSYKSGKESVTATMSGVIDFNLEGPTNVVPQVKTGSLRLLASTSSVRWFELPDVPTLREQGIDTYMESYAGLAAPAGTPAERLKILEAAFSQAVNDPEVQETMKGLGMEPFYFTSGEYRDLLVNGYDTMSTELVKVGLKK